MYSSTPSLTSDLVFPGGKVAEALRKPFTPSRSEVKEGVELYIYFPLGLRGLF